MMGDGETCEGSVWEAAMSARSFELGNLVAVIDRNKQMMCSYIDEDMTVMEPYADKWKAFGWNVVEIDGHDMNAIADALDSLPESGSDVPTMIISNTVKGKYISFMERQIKWHAGSLNEADLKAALADLDAAYAKQKEGM